MYLSSWPERLLAGAGKWAGLKPTSPFPSQPTDGDRVGLPDKISHPRGRGHGELYLLFVKATEKGSNDPLLLQLSHHQPPGKGTVIAPAVTALAALSTRVR